MDVPEERAQEVKEHYRRDDVVDEMVRVFKHREAAPTYDWGYGKRPDAVNFPGDFTRLVDDGAIAFHGSVERWKNPMLIDEVDSDDLRTGWDLIMDIDCDADMVFAKETAIAVLDELRSYGIDHVSVKFSGNRGFHLGIRGEAFPRKIQGTAIADWYPDLPQAIVSFLRDRLKADLAEKFVDIDPSVEDQVYGEDGEPRPYQLADLENNWGDRHLFRMPYSVNEKSWLVSLPIPADPEVIRAFDKHTDAAIENVAVEHRFLDAHEDGEATELAVDALDWKQRQEPDRSDRTTFEDGDFAIPDEAIDEEDFPPTIHNVLDGLEDGRKRAVFILCTFLANVGYDWDSIEAMIWEWNDRNDEPLDDTYIRTQLNWHARQDEPLMPPNWDANGFYQDMNVYEEDPLTAATSNPVSYARAKASDDDEDNDDSGSGSGGSKNKKPKVECPYCGKEYQGETKWYRDHVVECQG